MVYIISNPIPKGINPGAYRGELICPSCQSGAIRFVETIGPTRLRYRCRKCGVTFQYDISGRPNENPYAPLAKGGRLSGRIRDLLEVSKKPKGDIYK